MSITEGTQPAAKTWTGAWTSAQTTASFTPEAGALLVALLSGDGNQIAGAVTGSITDSLSGSWTLLKRQNTTSANVGGTAEVWVRDSPGTALTVSATGSGNPANGGQLVVRTLIGALPAASQNGATGGTTNDPAAAVSQSVAAGTGNKVYGAAFNWDASTAMTLLGNSSDVANFVDSTNGDNWAAFKSTGDTAGTATYGYSTSVRGMIAAVEIKAAPAGGAPLPFNPGKTWRRIFKHPQILPLPPPPAVVVATATPQPIVVTGPTSPPLSAVAITKRGTLQDDPVLTTQPPIVQTPQPAPRPAGVAIVRRGTLADDPVLTTAPPIVVTGGTPRPAGVTSLVRSSLIDLATPQPIVVTGPTPLPGVVATVQRGTLQDDPVLTTKPPAVVIGPTPLPAGGVAFTSRSSLADVVVVVASTVEPIVVTGPAPYPAGSSIVRRNTLADDPVLTTQPPIVVAAPKPQTPAGVSILTRGSLIDTPLATPAPIVVTGPTPYPAGVTNAQRSTLADPPQLITPGPIVVTGATPVPLNTPQPYMSRSSYADVVVAVGTPSPIVVASQVKQAAASPNILRRGSLQDDPVLTTPQPIVIALPYRRIPCATLCYAIPASGLGVPFSTTLTGNVHGPDGQIPAGLAGTAGGAITGNVQVAIGPLGGSAAGTSSGAIPGDMHGPSTPGEGGTIS